MMVYGAGYLIWYLGTPLGRAPQLDAAENLALAGKIAAGALPHEAFYRAILYPAVLAMPLKLGVPPEDLPTLASIFGLICHFAIALGVARLAARLWAGPGEKWAAFFAGVLWGFNPVALFYAVDVLDTVPSLALAIWALVWWTRPGMRKQDAGVGGVLLGLAVAARPHFLPLVFIAPLARTWLAGRWRPQLMDMMAWGGAGAVLLLLGSVQAWWGGGFRVLPTQGPYNFYAANRPGANGRYYTQQILFGQLAPGENPAQKEAGILYQKTGKLNSAPEGVYWNEQAWSAIEQHPGGWLKLMAKKTYYLFNDFDQYNNKTYAWHKQNSPWLRWNFLGWGVLFVAAAFVTPFAWTHASTLKNQERGARLAGVMLIFVTYAAGVLLYYASGRFRLPLAPLLCVLVAAPDKCLGLLRRNWKLCFWPLGALILTASNFFDAHDHSTFIQDELLSANAAAQVGDDALAQNLAQQVLSEDPSRPDARRIAVVSYFNLTLTGGKQYDNLTGWFSQMPLLQNLNLDDATLALVAGVAHWKTGDAAGAEKIWLTGARQFGPNSSPAQALAAAKTLSGETSPLPAPPPDPQMVAYLKIHR